LSFDDLEDDWEDEPRAPRRPSRDRGRERPPSRRSRRRRDPDGGQKTLLEVCRPAFQYVSVLPVEEGQQGPDFLRFREGVVNALQRIEPEARQHGIEIQDAQEAVYALALLIDEQVLESTWHAREEWAAQPLALHLLSDPEGGVNFFRRLERLRDDQTEVMQIYLFCLALGYRGMYVTEDVRKREATIEKIKQDLWRRIGTPGTESMEHLFPEGYTGSEGVEDEVEPPPRWWVWTSVGTVVVCLLLWFLLYIWAGASAESARESFGDVSRLAPRVDSARIGSGAYGC